MVQRTLDEGGEEIEGEQEDEEQEEIDKKRKERQVKREKRNSRLMFMQSSGGLIDAEAFQGKNCILSRPAGGIVGAVATSLVAGARKIITFDMGEHLQM